MAEKWGRVLLRTGAIVLILLGLSHILSLVEKPVPANDTEKQLMELTTGYKFNLAGSMRSFDNLFRGFSISFILGMLVVGISSLTLAGERTGVVRRLALINTVWLTAMTVVSMHYFFILPTLFMVSALCPFVAAWLVLLRASS